MAEPAATLRSHLYIPGDRPDRFDRAADSGADAVILDLEDAVGADHKGLALDAVVEWLTRRVPADGPSLWVRVNRGSAAEVRRLARCEALEGLCIPKTESSQDVMQVHRLAPQLRLAPLVESAVGVDHLQEIAAAPAVAWLHLGEIDLAADLGVTARQGDELDTVRAMLVMASRSAGLAAPPAPVSPELRDLQAFASTTLRLQDLGFAGRTCIHPRQVEVVHGLLAAGGDATHRAHRLLRAAQEHGEGAFAFEGEMIDEAVLRSARVLTGQGDDR